MRAPEAASLLAAAVPGFATWSRDRRWRVNAIVRRLGIRCVEDLRPPLLSEDAIETKLSGETQKCHARRLLRLLSRPPPPPKKRERRRPVVRTGGRRAPDDDVPAEQAARYAALCEALVPPPTGIEPRLRRCVLALLRSAARIALPVVDLPDLLRRVLPAAAEDLVLRPPNSLLVRGRQSRRGGGIDVLRAHYGRLQQALQLVVAGCPPGLLLPPQTDTTRIEPGTVARILRPRFAERLNGLQIFDDVVAGADTATALERCRDRRERIVVAMAGRLGMRLGAIQRLLVHNLLRDPPAAAVARWCVATSIRGVDKNGQVNTWHLDLYPPLTSLLEEYIHHEWRPAYEVWCDDAAAAQLLTAFLFPMRDWRRQPRAAQRPVGKDALGQWIRAPLRRAGIVGPHAHPHALRKGVATDLLRARNDPAIVARVLHHRSPRVTLESYDKRSVPELLASLVIPPQWRKNSRMEGSAETGAADESAAGSSGSGHITQALIEEMGMNDTLRQQLDLALTLLPPEQRAHYEAGCRQRGLPIEPPLPA